MAGALRPQAFALWVAWVVAGALGAAVGFSIDQPGNELLPNPGVWYWAPSIVLAVPLVLLQFLVLRGLAGVSVVRAGIWFVMTLVASAASVFANSAWYSGAPQVLTRVFGIDAGMNITFTVGDYMNPLLLGLAQGVVLAWVFGRTRFAAWWVVISLVAYAVSIRLTYLAITASGFDLRTVGRYNVVPWVAFEALYAAMTGLVLVGIWRTRAPVTPPPPASSNLAAASPLNP